MTLLILFLTGCLVGLISSFLGIGGGSVMVPILYWIMPELYPTEVIAISLSVIFVITFINIIIFKRQELIPGIREFVILLLSCGVGGFLGAYLLGYLDARTIKLIFATVLFLMLARVLLFKNYGNDNEQMPTLNRSFDLKLLITGLSGGLICGITGLGGGIVFTPMFWLFANFPKNVSLLFLILP
jgi:uncharacterized membrane protein YfcA